MPFKKRSPYKSKKRNPSAAPTAVSEEQKGNVTRGIVLEALANAHFRIQLAAPQNDAPADGEAVLQDNAENPPVIAYLAGKMRLHRIRVIVGDTVEVLLDQYGGKPRIIRRL